MVSLLDEILGFVQMLVRNPDSVMVRQLDCCPAVFEIAAHKEDLFELRKKEDAIRAIAGMPICGFDIRYVESESSYNNESRGKLPPGQNE